MLYEYTGRMLDEAVFERWGGESALCMFYRFSLLHKHLTYLTAVQTVIRELSLLSQYLDDSAVFIKC